MQSGKQYEKRIRREPGDVEHGSFSGGFQTSHMFCSRFLYIIWNLSRAKGVRTFLKYWRKPNGLSEVNQNIFWKHLGQSEHWFIPKQLHSSLRIPTFCLKCEVQVRRKYVGSWITKKSNASFHTSYKDLETISRNKIVNLSAVCKLDAFVLSFRLEQNYVKKAKKEYSKRIWMAWTQ